MKLSLLNEHMFRLYTTEEFVDNHLQTNAHDAKYFKKDYGSFFCGRIEDLLHLLTFPIPMSKGDTHCVYLVTAGSLNIAKGIHKYCLKEGDCLVVPAYHISSIESVEALLKGYFLSFSPGLLNNKSGFQNGFNTFNCLTPYANSYFPNSFINPFMVNLLKRLSIEYESNGLQKPNLVGSYLTALFYEFEYQHNDNTSVKVNQHQNITFQFKEHLFRNVKRLHRTSDYADLIGITPNHLNKVLKRTTGKSPIAWINETLILESKVLLDETGLSISEIAAKIGIYEPSYFTRLFKKVTQQTPKAYRNRLNNPTNDPF